MTDDQRLQLVRSLTFDPRVKVADYQDDQGAPQPSHYLVTFNGIESGVGVVYGNVCFYHAPGIYHRVYRDNPLTDEITKLVDQHLEAFFADAVSTTEGRINRQRLIFSGDF